MICVITLRYVTDSPKLVFSGFFASRHCYCLGAIYLFVFILVLEIYRDGWPIQ